MKQKTYLISETAKEVGVENHVLRYWEEELKLPIKRNELGHRFYTTEDIERFKRIKVLKDSGLQLKAVKVELQKEKMQKEKMQKEKNIGAQETVPVPAIKNPDREQKIERLQELLQAMMFHAVAASNEKLTSELKTFLAKELDYQFRMNEERQDENWKREEEYFQRIDEMIREKQTAGSKEGGKKLWFWTKKQNTTTE